MKKQTAKRALLMSALSLLLCVSMLIGTTFAWFTDSVTSAGNIIKSGTLDVEMYWADGTKDVPDATSQAWTDASQGAIFAYTLWEPGYTEVRHIKIANEGTLALKYQLRIKANGEVSALADVIDVYYMDPAVQVANRADLAGAQKLGTLTQVLNGLADTANGELLAGASDTVTLALKMQETAGNEYQNLSIGASFSVVLLATQLTAEDDSFDDQYDKDSLYPEVSVTDVTKGDAATAVKNEDETVMVEIPAEAPNGGYTLLVTDKTVKSDDQGSTVVSMDINLLKDGVKVSDGNEYTVRVNLGAGLQLTKLMHNGQEITNYDYDMLSGVVTFTTTGFSPFSFTYKDVGNIVVSGNTGYTSLADAIAAAQDGETVTLIKDTETADGVLISNKNITVDLNGKTFTVTEGASTSNRNFKIIGSSVVTVKNGTLIAAGTLSGGTYGTIRTEGSANVTLENLKLYNYRGGGLNVKAVTGTNVTINDCEIYSQYGGGVEASGGTLVLNNTKIDQQGVYTNGWYSVAMEINSNGKITVNSGEYSGRAIATDANATMGNTIAFILSSGGTLDINGGTFTGVVAETAAAGNFCGVIYADTGAVVNIKGGTFNSNGAILDMRNNTGNAQRNPRATLSGGTFSADPRVSGLYASNLISVAANYEVVENNGTFTVEAVKAAQVGDAKYTTLEAAVAAAKAGDEIKLLQDVTLSAELTLPAGITLNGNSKQINGTVYAGGNLTIVGHTKVTGFSASYYNRTITIGEGACLEITGTGRVTLGYGNTFNITGSIANAKEANKAAVQPSLIIPGGLSITGGNDATMNVTNAYIVVGNTSSKNSAANGEFTMNFTNSIVEFTNQLTFATPTSGKNPTFNVNLKDSVLTTATKWCIAAANTNVVIDNSNVTLGTYFRNSGKLELLNGSVLNGATIQFGENGGNDGTTIVDNSTLNINASSTGHALDGQNTGKIELRNGATASVTYYKNLQIVADSTSTMTGTAVN